MNCQRIKNKAKRLNWSDNIRRSCRGVATFL